MKTILICLGVLLLGIVVRAEEKPTVTMPEEVILTSGRVLKKVSVVRWEKDRVVLKYAGGVDPIAFSLIAEPLRSQLEGIRDAAKKAEVRAREMQKTPSSALPDEATKYQGQVFIVTRGAGSYKMGGVNVYILPESSWDAMDYVSQPIFLPKPLIKVTSDADGKFDFSLPRGLSFVVLAQGRRLVGAREETYEWRVRSQDVKQLPSILLGNDNHTSVQRSYRFEE